MSYKKVFDEPIVEYASENQMCEQHCVIPFSKNPLASRQYLCKGLTDRREINSLNETGG